MCGQAVVGGPSDGVTWENSDLRQQEARARGCVRMRVCLSRYVGSVRACVRECNCANAHAHASHVLV